MKRGVRRKRWHICSYSLHTFALCLMRCRPFVLHIIKWEWTAFKWQGMMLGSRNFAKSHWDSGFMHMLDFWKNGIALPLPFTLASSSISKPAHCVLMALATFLKQSGLREYVCNASDDMYILRPILLGWIEDQMPTYRDWYAENWILGHWADRLDVNTKLAVTKKGMI